MNKPKKAFCCWSGGKESALSFFRARKMNMEIGCLVNMISDDGKHSRTHGICSDLIQAQAEVIEVSLIQARTSWNNYEDEFKKVISSLRDQGLTTGIFGDIDLQPHRDWVERVCAEIGIEPILPLWQETRETLLNEFIDLGFKTIIVATRSEFMGSDWLGREINKEFINNLTTLDGVDLCGEKGEYHTFVYDGSIFRRPVEFVLGEKVFRQENWFLELKVKQMEML